MSNTKFKIGQSVKIDLAGTVETWRSFPKGTQYLVAYTDNNGDEQERWFWEPELAPVTSRPKLAVIEGGKA